MRRAAALCCLVLVAAPMAVGCATEERADAAQGSYSLEQAREFGDFELYALGDAYGDLPLTDVIRVFDPSPEAPPVRANYVAFIYGTCDASAGGCAPPLSIQVWAACERNPMVYSPVAGQERPIE